MADKARNTATFLKIPKRCCNSFWPLKERRVAVAEGVDREGVPAAAVEAESDRVGAVASTAAEACGTPGNRRAAADSVGVASPAGVAPVEVEEQVGPAAEEDLAGAVEAAVVVAGAQATVEGVVRAARGAARA